MALDDRLKALLGPSGWLTGADVGGMGRDWLDRHGAAPLGVARPATTEQVAVVVRECRAAGVPLVPQGGNTGLCAAAVCGTPGGVILSLARMADIGPLDTASGSVEVGAGLVLGALHAALEGTGHIFPMQLGAEGTAQIGGLIGTNAGGSHALRYGMMADLVLGLEVVLPDGTVWTGLRAVMKDNAGYGLRRMFCGSEGTLGIVTRAVLRLSPRPRQVATALLALPDAETLVAFGAQIRAEAGEFVNGLEFFCDTGTGWVLDHLPHVTLPLDNRAPWYLLVELTAGSDLVPLDAILERLLERGMESGAVLDGTLAMSEAQRKALWQLREEQPEGQRLEGPQAKHDIAVPPGRLAAFLEQGAALCQQTLPGVRINPFGHLGDGNVHYNLSPPLGASGFADTAQPLAEGLGRIATDLGGSFAAEHGLGRTKITLADRLRSPVERALMRRVKDAFDPEGLLNPGVITDR